MSSNTSCFPQLRYLFGRARKSSAQCAADLFKDIRDNPVGQLETLFSSIIRPHWLQAEHVAGPKRRNRVFNLRVTFWSFLDQVVKKGSCRDAVRVVQALRHRRGQAAISSQNVAYCKARQRLPLALLQKILQKVFDYLKGRTDGGSLWHGRRVLVVDGTSCSMPDTAANQEAFPQPGGQKPGCGFPVVQLVGLFDLASAGLWHFARTPWYVHEASVFLSQILQKLRRGDLLLADRAYCSYLNLALLLDKGVDALMRLHQRRRVKFPRGRREIIVQWLRPAAQSRPAHMSKEQWRQLPSLLTLRCLRIKVTHKGFRSKEIIVVTTLLDAQQYPFEELAALYLRRWAIELSFRDIKTTLGMEVVGAKTPDMVAKEITIYLIVYNLVRALMVQSSQHWQCSLQSLSFKGALDTIGSWASTIERLAQRPRLCHRAMVQMLRCIATDLVPQRPGRSEPRAVKRRPKGYQFLTSPRHLMKISPSRRIK